MILLTKFNLRNAKVLTAPDSCPVAFRDRCKETRLPLIEWKIITTIVRSSAVARALKPVWTVLSARRSVDEEATR